MFATWNAGACCGAPRDERVDDVGFIRAALKRVMGQLNIDRQRVYATGMFNGAMMAYGLACKMPALIRAVAAVAGTDNTRSCTPGQPVSVDKARVTDYRSVQACVARWVEFNDCQCSPQRVMETSGVWCEVCALPWRDAGAVVCDRQRRPFLARGRQEDAGRGGLAGALDQ